MTNDFRVKFESLAPEEQKAVTALRERMAGCMKPEMYSDISLFVRFLRARSLNLNAAETMLRNHLEWRKINQVDTILKEFTPKEVAKKYVTMNIMGLDKEGAPILFFYFGHIDARGILKSCRKTDVIKCIVQVLEEAEELLKKQSCKLNKNIDKWTMILNFANFPFAVATHKETLDITASLITMYESHYPERLKVAFFINASLYFTLGFAVVKHFISGPTYKKIKFYGNEGWKEDLLEVVSEDVLPGFLGGKRTDPDGNPMCYTIINHGGLVDEKYFINKKETSIANQKDVKKLTVTRMSKIQIPLTVTKPGNYIEWEFETKNRDIAFSLLYKEHENDINLQELVPKQRIDTYMSSETGMMKCDNAGIYIIEFDNSFSWIFKKEIYYRISVTGT